jgi:hypothetical protein
MIRRTVFLALAAAIALRAAALAQDWSDVIAPDMRFKVEMPAPVQRNSADERDPSFAGPRTTYEAMFGRRNFELDYVDYRPEQIERRDRREMVLDLGRGVAEKQFPRPQFRYVRDEAVTLEGWEGYALDIETPGGEGIMMRTYLVKNRLYRLLATYDADPATKAAAERFIDSFRVADQR